MKNIYPFIYQATVAWYDNSEQKSYHYRIAGLGFCDSYTDAVRQIEEREGETLETIEHLEIIGEKGDTIIEIPPRLVRPIIDFDPGDLEPYKKELI